MTLPSGFVHAVALSLLVLLTPSSRAEDKVKVHGGIPAITETADIVVYGGTPAGIAAAVQAARMGKSVILLEPGKYLGGMVTGGLGATDKGIVWTVGGLAREFFSRVYDYYQKPAAWQHETRAQYFPKHGQIATESMHTQWYFEPKVATAIFNSMLQEADVKVLKNERLQRKGGVTMKDGAIQTIALESGLKVEGKYFIDATYEGDLMASAGVDYIVGRESREKYGESLNGVRLAGRLALGHSPYVEADKPESGLLPRIEPQPPGADGAADHRTQAYNFRMCLTNVPENRVPFAKPAGYDPKQYELHLRMMQKRGDRPVVPFKLTPMPNLKTDSNNAIYLSTDFIGGSYDWPEASYEEREKILAAHRAYVEGFFWFLQNDPRVPDVVREKVQDWGLARDEFTENGNWPTQLYVREARRMVGDYVMNQNNFSAHPKAKEGKKNALPETAKDPVTDGIAVGSYAIDCHVVTLFVDGGQLYIEGNMGAGPRPYAISYRSLLPKEDQAKNLLVPICLSSSHVAYATMRMEPVYMELGQAAATAACLALDNNTSLYKLPYALLREQLLKDKVVLDPTAPEKPPKAAKP